MNKVLSELSGGDLRTDGRANEVADDVIKNPRLLPNLMEGLQSPDKVIRMRTAHALEVISRNHQEIIAGIKRQLIDSARKDDLPEVRWHLAQVFDHISLSTEERDQVIAILFDYLKGDSVLVKAWSIGTLGILAKKDKSIQGMVSGKIKAFQNDKSPAVRNRVKQVLKGLGK